MPSEPSKKSIKTLVTILISILFACLFMWLAVRGLNIDHILESLYKANYFWIAVSALFGLLAYWVRAIRWNLLLEPMGYTISNSNALWSLSFGYLMNLTIPRSGEVARSTALYSVERVPVDQSFGTIILERIVDLICMVFFLLLTLIFKYKAILAFYELASAQKEQNPQSTPYAQWVAVCAFSLVAILFIIFRKKILKTKIYTKISSFIKGVLVGLKSIINLKQKKRFVLLSLGIWLCYYLATYLVCFSLPETQNLDITDGFFIIVVGTLGMMVPASGGIGAFHFALKLGFMALFLSMDLSPEAGASAGLSYAFISHTMQLVIMVVMGMISIPMLAKSKKINF